MMATGVTDVGADRCSFLQESAEAGSNPIALPRRVDSVCPDGADAPVLSQEEGCLR